MNKLIRIIPVVAGCVLLASCDLNKYPEFDDKDAFAAIDVAKMSVKETVGKISIPVTIASVNPIQTSVTYTVADGGTAKEGENYSFVDKSGVLSFNGEERTKTIDINIADLSGIYTGDVSFTINLVSATSNVNLGAEKTCVVTIEDLDHPLADVLGEYTVTATDYAYGPQQYTMSLTKDDNDATIVWCDYITPLAKSYPAKKFAVWGTVSEDHSTITFSLGQKPGADLGYGSMVLCTFSISAAEFDISDEGELVFTKTSEGVFSTNTAIAFVDDEYVWQGALLLGEENTTVWTKK